MQPASRLTHLVRGSSAAAAATFVALFAHVLGGGAPPALLGTLVPFVLSLTVCVLLAGRTLSLARLSFSVVLSQTLFHALFVLGTPIATATAAGPSDIPQAPHQHGVPAGWAPFVSDQTASLIVADATMWISHLLGAALTIAFLYRGEQALSTLLHLGHRIVRWMRHRLTAPLPAPVAQAPLRRPAAQTTGWSVLSRVLASSLCTRGPPAPFRIA